MLGLLTYLPTLALVPHLLFIIAIAYALALKLAGMVYYKPVLTERKRVMDINFMIIILIVFLSLINNAFHYEKVIGFEGYFPFYLLVPFSFLIAFTMTRTDLKVIVILSLVEAFTVLLEYALGISTFFPSLELYTEFQENELFYFSRPLGLSENSSIAASKFIVAYILIDYIGLKERFWDIVKVILLAGVFLTFNRTSLLVMTVYLMFSFGKTVLNYKSSRPRYFFMVSVTWLFIAASLVVIGIYWHEIIIQLTRNTKRVELTGRELIWANYLEFIQRNIFLGNGSYKLYMGDLHAHNSFIQNLATNGLLISIFYFYLILRNLNKQNIIPAGMLLLYSFFQYGIFWGISLMDIALFIFLFREKSTITEYRFYLAEKLRIKLPDAHGNH